jgi:glycine dehydrogenase
MPANPKTLAADFASRHIGPSPSDVEAMLTTLGVSSLDALIEQTVPASIRHPKPLEHGPAMSEVEVLAHLKGIAAKNQIFSSFIGMGYHGTHLPGVILRNILENPAWYTAYTPYQPEISQGRLEALINYQTMITDLTGLDVSNASLLDEATAAAEAMTVARRVATQKQNTFFVDHDVHPQTLALIITRADPRSARPDCAGKGQRRRADCGGRSVGAHRAGVAGGAGRRDCVGIDATLRRAHGLRRSPRGLFGCERRLQTPHAGPVGGCVD